MEYIFNVNDITTTSDLIRFTKSNTKFKVEKEHRFVNLISENEKYFFKRLKQFGLDVDDDVVQCWNRMRLIRRMEQRRPHSIKSGNKTQANEPELTELEFKKYYVRN